MSDPENEPDDEEGNGTRRMALIALAVLIVLVAGGIWLNHSLHQTGRLQDCVMAGRTNCAPVSPP
jgi:hypothetical protein